MKYRKDIIYPVAFVIAAAISIGYKVVASGRLDGFFLFPKKDEIVVESEEEPEEPSDTSEGTVNADGTSEQTVPVEMISVYVSGAVRNPGVYQIPSGSIVNDAVTAAGGFTEEAAYERLDLVYMLTENRTIYIPTGSEVGSGADVGIISFDGNDGASAPEGGSEGSLININTASDTGLQTLPGIGPATAQAIIEYREENPFSRIEDIMNVPGIGEGRFERIRDLICVE